MNVAIVGRYRTNSANGVDRTIVGHIDQLSKLGHSVTLLTWYSPNEIDSERLQELGVKVTVLPSSVIFYSREFYKLRGSFDVTILHSVFTLYNWIATMIIGGHWVTTPHGGYSPGQLSYKRPRLKKMAFSIYERKMLKNALAVHVLSDIEAQQLKRVEPHAKALIAPNGIDLQYDNYTGREPVGDILRMVFVGRLALHHKGLDILMKSLSSLKTVKNWQLDVIGPDKEGALPELQKILEGSPNKEKIIFHGAKYGAEKDALINKAHIFVHTSRYEGMPFSIIESLEQGLPVIVTPETNVGELIQTYDAGWVVDSGNLTKALSEIIDQAEGCYPQKSMNARKLVCEELLWDNIGSQLFGQLEKLVNSQNIK